MKRRKKIQFRQIKKHHQVPAETQYPGLVALLQESGLLDEHGKATEEGKKVINDAS